MPMFAVVEPRPWSLLIFPVLFEMEMTEVARTDPAEAPRGKTAESDGNSWCTSCLRRFLLGKSTSISRYIETGSAPQVTNSEHKHEY